MGKSGGGGQNTVTSNAAPPPEVMAQYENLIGQANTAAGQPLQQYNGNIVAPFNATQNQAFNEVQNAQGIQQPLYNQAQGLIQNASQPITPTPVGQAQIDQYTNPYTQNVINSTLANINQQNAGQQSQLMGNAASQGAWGGDRSAVAQALLANQQDLAKNQTIAGLQSQGYSQALGEANTQQQANLSAQEASQYLGQQGGFGLMNLGTQTQNAALTGANALTAAGGLQQQLAQEQLNVPYEQFQQQQAYPYQNLSWLSGISTGLGGGMGGSSSTTSPGPSTASQLGGLGLTGLGIYGAAGGFSGAAGLARGGHVDGLIKRLATGGAVMMPAHYDMGGIIPGQITREEMDNAGIPDLSRNPRFSLPTMTKGTGVPSMMKSEGKNSTTTGGNDGVGGSIGTDIAAARGLKRIIGGSGAGEGLASRAGTSFDVANAQANGLGNMVEGFQNADGTTNLVGGVNAAGDSIGAGTTDAAAPSFLSNIGNAMGFGDSAGIGSATGSGVDYLASSSTLPWLADAGATAAADTGATIAADTAATDIAASTPEWLPALMAFFNKGGAVQNRARGGLIKHYDDGGLVPSDTSASPLANEQSSKYAQMPIEQLRQLSTRIPLTTPQGQMLQKVIQQKQLMPNVGQNAAAPNMPMAALASQQQPGLVRGGLIKGYDDGGGVDDADWLERLDNAASSANSTPIPDNKPALGLPAAPVEITRDAFADNAPSAGLIKADPTLAAAPPRVDYTPTAPINKPDPWLALAAAGAGMMSSKSPHALEALGEGAQAGLQNYGTQKKEAANESYQQGNLQKAAEQLAQEAVQHKDTLAQQQAALAETSRYHSGELGLKREEMKNAAANQIAERQKPIPDGFGGFIIPNLQDPSHPTQVDLGGGGADSTKQSIANIYNPPVGEDGNPLRGEEFLKTIPSPIAAQARLYMKGDAPPPTGFAAKPALLAAQQAAAVADPTWTGQRYSTLQDFTKGPQTAKTVQAQNVTMEHIGTLQDAINALDNGDIRQFNRLSQEVARQTGSPVPTNFELGKTIVYDEMAKAILGANSAVSDRQAFVQNMDIGSSRAQAKGQLDEAGKYMAGQAYGLENRYTAGSGLTNYRDRFMTPTAKKLIEKYYPSSGGGAGQSQQNDTPSPKSVNWVVQNGKLVKTP